MNRKLKSLLVRKGIKQKEIADALGINRCVVSNVIAGRSQSRPVKRKIAEMLNADYHKLWGKAA